MHHPKILPWTVSQCSCAQTHTGLLQLPWGLHQGGFLTYWLFFSPFHNALAIRTSAVSRTVFIKVPEEVSCLSPLNHKILLVSFLFSQLVTSTGSCHLLERSSAEASPQQPIAHPPPEQGARQISPTINKLTKLSP